MLYKGSFCWYGEDYTLYTEAKDKDDAFKNFVSQLGRKLKRNRSIISVYFLNQNIDNWKIEVNFV